MKTIENYRADCLVLLGDTAGRRYLPEQLDMAFREALGTYRDFCPRMESVNARVIRVENGAAVLNWPFWDEADLRLVRKKTESLPREVSYCVREGKLILWGDSISRCSAGDVLELTAGLPHSIKGLDERETTTVPDRHGLTLCKGAAAAALRIRARSVTEVFGKRPEDGENLLRQAETLSLEFLAELRQAAYRESLRRDPWPPSLINRYCRS